jgi:hypothetical protein
MEGWIMTDDDSCQYRRRRPDLCTENNPVFELYQMQEVPSSGNEPRYAIAHDLIDFAQIDIGLVLDSYGYNSTADLQKDYGDDWKGVMAECQFELDAGSLSNVSCHMPMMTWPEAREVIETLVSA